MPEVTNHVHGTPSWTDLASPDPAASKEFYGPLFGWDFEENDTDGGGTYVMCSKGGKSAAGMMQLSEQMAAAGMPPVWSTYVTVDDIEATAAKVEPAGGRMMQPPMDVMDNGRMAVLADSTGAMICLWETKESIGAEVVNEHGALTWNELMSKDPGQAASFYADVLGWTTQVMPMPDGDYTVFHTPGGDENGVAGAMKSPVEGMPSFWGVYFAVDDCNATVAAATEAGATVMAGPMDIPGVGRFATLTDPQGAVFSVMTGGD